MPDLLFQRIFYHPRPRCYICIVHLLLGEDQEPPVARKDHVGGRRAEEEFAEEAGWSR